MDVLKIGITHAFLTPSVVAVGSGWGPTASLAAKTCWSGSPTKLTALPKLASRPKAIRPNVGFMTAPIKFKMAGLVAQEKIWMTKDSRGRSVKAYVAVVMFLQNCRAELREVLSAATDKDP